MDNETKVLDMYNKLRKSVRKFILCELSFEFVIVISFSLVLAFLLDTDNTRNVMIWFLLLMATLGGCMFILMRVFFGSPKGFFKVTKFTSTVDYLQKQIKDSKVNDNPDDLKMAMTIYNEEINNLANQLDEMEIKKS